jgi:hypothetical protein
MSTEAANTKTETPAITLDGVSRDVAVVDQRIARLEAEVLALRQALIDLAALLRNAGPPTKGALECVTNTLDRLEPLL